MGKKLVIKGADFSVNAVEVSSVSLPFITSGSNVRANTGVSVNFPPDTLTMEVATVSGISWSTYVADVSQYQGCKIRISSANGYSDQVYSNGGFFAELDQAYLVNGFTVARKTAVGVPLLEVMGVDSSADANVLVTKVYTIPQGANYLIFTCKTSVLSAGEAASAVVETFGV